MTENYTTDHTIGSFFEGYDMEEILEGARSFNFSPGAYLFGALLHLDLTTRISPKLRKRQLLSPIDYFNSVAALGDIPIVFPAWVEQLLRDLPEAIDRAIEQAGLALDRREITALLAQGLSDGFLHEYQGGNLTPEDLERKGKQEAIRDQLLRLANPDA
ncbi:hypothetical protein HY612_01945 [Candidatus Roizmanbacteria bacterium]|nr:hypothetical protein [Candidatus Roizmanbacteria bacterium]